LPASPFVWILPDAVLFSDAALLLFSFGLIAPLIFIPKPLVNSYYSVSGYVSKISLHFQNFKEIFFANFFSQLQSHFYKVHINHIK
jgi:hypothetical protein